MKDIEKKAVEFALVARAVRDIIEDNDEVESLFPTSYGEKIYGHYYQPTVNLDSIAWNEMRRELTPEEVKTEDKSGRGKLITRWFTFFGVRFENQITPEYYEKEKEREHEEEEE